MWRWTSIIMAAFVYLPVRFGTAAIVTGTDTTSTLAVEFVPLVFAMVFVGVIIFAPK